MILETGNFLRMSFFFDISIIRHKNLTFDYLIFLLHFFHPLKPSVESISPTKPPQSIGNPRHSESPIYFIMGYQKLGSLTPNGNGRVYFHTFVISCDHDLDLFLIHQGSVLSSYITHNISTFRETFVFAKKNQNTSCSSSRHGNEKILFNQ